MQVICLKNSRFNGFVLTLLCILALGQNLTLENFQFCRRAVLEGTNIFEQKLVFFPES